MAAVVVGRDAELASIRDFVAGVTDGASALVLEGEAGMGKTTLWRAGVQTAESAGLTVLRAEPAESETALSFSGLGDLLDPVLDEALAPLPEAQRSALSRALVLEDLEGSPPDAHAAGVALLNALRGLTSTRDLLVAVDDVQWLDAASAAALAYAARRLGGERVGILLARRSGVGSSVIDELRRTPHCGDLEVGPLDLASLHQLVQAHLGIALPRPLLAEVHQASGGNPFYALEIVRTLTRSDVSVEAGRPLPVPDSLRDLAHGRLHALPQESRDFLVAAAAHAHPTVTVTETASGVSRAAGLAPAVDAHIVEVHDDRIRFTHPLLAAGSLETADSQRRAEIHARLAELLEDPEARAWQLAASVQLPNEDVAATLEDAARHARARGAPRPAALLLDRARALTPADRADEACRRAVDAAYLHYESGDSLRAADQLQAVIASLPPGRLRARALMRLARVRSYQAQEEATALFLQAIEEAGDDRETLAVAHEGVATCLFRRREQLEDAVDHAELAAQLALGLGDEALAAEALGSKLLPETLLGRETAEETAAHALALQEAADDRRVLGQPLWMVSVYGWWTDSVERARAANRKALQRAAELGDESSVPYVLLLTAMIETLVGAFDAAHRSSLDGQHLAEQSGQTMPLAYNLAIDALVEAHRGRADAARSAARRALELVPETAGRPAELVAGTAIGHLELALGDAGAAHAALAPVIEFARLQSFGEPGAMRFVVDDVEALTELGRTDEALELLDWYEGKARRLERVSALANCARCRGLLAAQEGDIDRALAAYEEALQWHAKVELPMDRGRTLLALGAAQRRLKRRREARATLEEALAVFERIDAAIWAERARAELKRISGRAATPGALTPAEERVAALVAEGKTNREVAAALFLSERTVEGHLSRIFGELGIRHRTELARSLQTQGIGPSNTGDPPVSAESVAP
jgi:DNA-binding CsgD family transcriptional regulator/predicted negative regulator of RcsB-dependent stress response